VHLRVQLSQPRFAAVGALQEQRLGGDHGYPHAIACLRSHNKGAWRVALGGHTAEGGSPGFVLGADYQTKVFAPDGKLLRRIGTKGAQRTRLEFDSAALHSVEATSVDDDGSLWVAERQDQDRSPGLSLVRRIAVWNRDGQFVKDFVGTTWYSANTCCLHEQDPTLGYGYRVLYKLGC